MSETIDLDALVPPSVTIKFSGETIEVKPPKTGDVLRLGTLGQQLGKADELTPDELEKAVQDVTNLIYTVVPELAQKPLNTAQLLALVKIISDMSIPPDSKELSDRGITVDSPKAA